MAKKIAYIFDYNILKECDRLPNMLNRASIVQDLIISYRLLDNEGVIVIPSEPATEDELKTFHSSNYVEYIKKNNTLGDVEVSEEQTTLGLCYDCPLLDRLYDLIQALAGGSLTAAKLISRFEYDTAINWFGGWHHAQRDEAEGFCYVNDIVIAIQHLSETFSRILYIDLDIHHGNSVQNAFEFSRKILTLSFHKYSPGFYPGSGNVDDIGRCGGKYYSINVPLLEGCSNKTYLRCFKAIFPNVFRAFKPKAMVVQCGADCIKEDPIGQVNITPVAMGQCIMAILNCQIPTLFLGGGGYNAANTARYWTYLTSVIFRKELDNDIPDCSEYFTIYGPTYELEVEEGYQKDCNSEDYIDGIVKKILCYCNFIKSDEDDDLVSVNDHFKIK